MNYLDFAEPIKSLREQLYQSKEIQYKNYLDMAALARHHQGGDALAALVYCPGD